MRQIKPIMTAMITLSFIALAVGAQAKQPSNPGHGNAGGGSQAGGLPALADKVNGLQSTLTTDVTNLQNQINTLDASTAFVSMTGAGSINYSKDVDSSTHPATGSYEVTFTRDVSKCVAVASVHIPTGTMTPAFAMVGRSSVAQVVTVAIFQLDGTALDEDFELAVTC